MLTARQGPMQRYRPHRICPFLAFAILTEHDYGIPVHADPVPAGLVNIGKIDNPARILFFPQFIDFLPHQPVVADAETDWPKQSEIN
jgi:hypothetical protein